MRTRLMRAALVATLTFGSSCSVSRTPPSVRAMSARGASSWEVTGPSLAARIRPKDPIVLVTIDGSRWQEIFDGSDPSLSKGAYRSPSAIVPTLDRLIHGDGAAVGAPGRGLLRATGPNYVSLPGYMELLGGASSLACGDNYCSATEAPTFLDEASDAGAAVAAFGSWPSLRLAVTSRPGSFYVSCGRAPGEGGDRYDPYPGSGDYRPDPKTGDAALAYLESEQPDVMFIGLGDPDELAHAGNYDGYLDALSRADRVVGRLLETLGRMGDRGARTNVVVTADHGRANDFVGHGGWAPESARVWLVATGPAVAVHGMVVSPPAGRRLADVAPTLRAMSGMSPAPADRKEQGSPIFELLNGG